jgi:predicted secreted Zn-dependent protease
MSVQQHLILRAADAGSRTGHDRELVGAGLGGAMRSTIDRNGDDGSPVALPRARDIFGGMKAIVVIVALASAGALGCVAPSVIQFQRRAGIDVDDHVEYYDIHGKTLRDLRIDARVNGPVSRDTTWFAVTHYQIHWTYSYSRQPALCRLTNVRTYVEITVTLPRWVDSSDVDPAAVYWWGGASEQVRAHEAHHVQLAVDGAAEIRSLLSRKTGGDCAALARDANGEAAVILQSVAERQREFDRVSRHGTVLPTRANRSGP